MYRVDVTSDEAYLCGLRQDKKCKFAAVASLAIYFDLTDLGIETSSLGTKKQEQIPLNRFSLFLKNLLCRGTNLSKHIRF